MREMRLIMFFFLSLWFLFKAQEKKRSLKACHGNKIAAKIVDHGIKTIYGTFCLYYPIYGYEKHGEYCTFQSEIPSISAFELDTEIPIYYDERIRKPVEAAAGMIEMVLAMVFGAMAMLLA